MVKHTSQVISDFFSIIFPATPSTSSSIHEEEADMEESRSSGAMASSTSTDASLLIADVSSIAQGTTSSIIIADILHSPDFKLISVCCHIVRKKKQCKSLLNSHQTV